MILLVKSGDSKYTTVFLKRKVFFLIVQDNIHPEPVEMKGSWDATDKLIPSFGATPGGY